MYIRLPVNGGFRNKELALVSHRGGKGFGPENTLQSLEAAIDFGVEMVETDVRMSKDGVPVIHHSPFLGFRLLGHMTAREIEESAPEVPTLEEYLELAAGRCALNLEIKKCDPAVLAEAIGGVETALPILVSSFDADFLVEFSRTGSPVQLGVLSQYELSGDRLLREADACGATTLLPVSYSVREDLVRAAHAAGLRVVTWTVNSSEHALELLHADVDGIITDSYPELKEWLENGLPGTREGLAPVAGERPAGLQGGPNAYG